jgi:hypothetical protein
MNKTLKDYIVDYRNGNKLALNYLIGYKKVPEQNNKGDIDYINRIKYNDKKLQEIYFDLSKKFNWVDNKNVEEWFLNGLYEVVFAKADIEKTPQEIISWVAKTLNGYIKNKIGKETDNPENVVRESFDNSNPSGEDDEQQDKILSLYDYSAYKEYTKIEHSSVYQDFLKFVGGIENVLTKQQMKLYELMQDPTKTQDQLAVEYGSSQENINKLIAKINKSLKAKWLYYVTVKSFAKTGIYEKVSQFVDEFDNILEFDKTDSFDYFGRIIKFLKENYTKGEQELEFHENLTYLDESGVEKKVILYDEKQVIANKVGLSSTMFDIVADSVTRNTYNNLKDILDFDLSEKEFDEFQFGKRAKKIIVNQVMGAFRNYVNECQIAIEKASSLIANKKKLDSNNLLKKIG